MRVRGDRMGKNAGFLFGMTMVLHADFCSTCFPFKKIAVGFSCSSSFSKGHADAESSEDRFSLWKVSGRLARPVAINIQSWETGSILSSEGNFCFLSSIYPFPKIGSDPQYLKQHLY